jgi:hypothetical protein
MALHSTQAKIENAVLVGLQLPGMTELEMQSSLDELHRLVTTLGYNVIGRVWRRKDLRARVLRSWVMVNFMSLRSGPAGQVWSHPWSLKRSTKPL